MRRLTEKMKDMEAWRKWNSKSNELQYLHQVRVKQIRVEDYRQVLEEYFGSKRKVPASIKAVVRKDEKEINGYIKVLRMADRVSWKQQRNVR